MKLLRYSLLAATAVGWPLAALANDVGVRLPWNDPLDILRQNLSGPTATVLILIAITFGMVMWSFSDRHEGLMRVGKALVAIAVVAYLANLLGPLGLEGAVL